MKRRKVAILVLLGLAMVATLIVTSPAFASIGRFAAVGRWMPRIMAAIGRSMPRVFGAVGRW